MSVLFDTSHGTIVIDLLTDICPKTCENFLALCALKYYNNCVVFNIERGHFIQLGAKRQATPAQSSTQHTTANDLFELPEQDGTHGESAQHYAWRLAQHWGPAKRPEPSKYLDSLEIHPKLKFHKQGLVAMAGAPKHQSSQFFITTSEKHLDWLDGKACIFGLVAEGLDVLQQIDLIPTRTQGQSKKPLQTVRVRHVSILWNPLKEKVHRLLAPLSEAEQQAPLPNPLASPPPFKDFPDMLREDADLTQPQNQFTNMTPQQIQDKITAENASSQKLFLHLAGYLPEEDAKPPENLLFVCKLNPKTKAEDLELIFSQFGHINKCNIIYDKDGISQCYAFIEFETQDACEKAYLKMQNVVIDERRIVVDFAQSVSQTYWKDGRKMLANQPAKDPHPSNSNSKLKQQPNQQRKKPPSHYTHHARPQHGPPPSHAMPPHFFPPPPPYYPHAPPPSHHRQHRAPPPRHNHRAKARHSRPPSPQDSRRNKRRKRNNNS